jgi:hypothetical protein
MDTKGFPPLTVHSKLSPVFREIPGENPVTSGGLGGYFRGVRAEQKHETKRKKQNQTQTNEIKSKKKQKRKKKETKEKHPNKSKRKKNAKTK